MESTPADAVRRVLTTAGITGAVFTLSAAAALPALACHSGGQSQQTQSQQTRSQKDQSQKDQSGADKATSDQAKGDDDGTSGDNKADSHKPDSHKSDSHQSGADQGKSEGDEHGSKSKGASNGSDNGPGGDNGHAFIKQAGSDLSREGNQPHVTCAFNVSFFGFDRNQALDVSFDGHAPSGSGHVGGGSFTVPATVGTTGDTYDGSLAPAGSPITLDVSGLSASKQGYHIKMTVTTHQPGDHKYKVFWYQPCSSPTTPQQGGQQQGGQQQGGQQGSPQQGAQQGTTQTGVPTATGTTTGAGVLGATTATAAAPAAPAQVLGETAGAAPAPAAPAQVLGESISRPTATTARPGTQVLGSAAEAGALPFTGAEVGLMSAAGIAAIGGGAALTVAGRRRRRAAATP